MPRFSLVGQAAALLVLGSACGDEEPRDTVDPIPTGPEVFGCPTYPEPIAEPGEDIDGDDYDNFASLLFQDYCVRCHSTELVTPEERHNAPEGLNWNDVASIRTNLSRIRAAIGVINFMPPEDPKPSCDERMRLVRWIDAAAPGLP